jgi:hypothetical protein
MMFHHERGQMQLSVVAMTNNGIMPEPEASAELVETLREADEALQFAHKRTVSKLRDCYVEMLREVDEALQIAYERTVSELRYCYVEMLREVNEALRILYEMPMSGLSTYYAPIPRELNEGPLSQCEIAQLELWSPSIETLSKPNEALERAEPFSELVAAVESNDLLKEYGSPIYGRAVGFSLN